MTKKLMALLLAVLMAVSLLPMPAMADDAQVITDLSGISAEDPMLSINPSRISSSPRRLRSTRT